MVKEINPFVFPMKEKNEKEKWTIRVKECLV
jgi:hypothetical protein